MWQSILNRSIRNFRGWLYRRLPAWTGGWWAKRRTGFERRWNLEEEGFTKEGWVQVWRTRVVGNLQPGKFLELAVGDGLVGSLGVWLQVQDPGWKVEAWEHRREPFRSFKKHRTGTPVYPARLTQWTDEDVAKNPLGITTRGAREASGVLRAIRQGRISPKILGIWNPSRRPVWYRRLVREGYRLRMVWHNMEIYRGPG